MMGWSWSRFIFCILLLQIIGAKCDIEVHKNESASDVLVKEKLGYNNPVVGIFYEPGLAVRQILDLEKSQWHWHPWKHVDYFVNSLGEEEEEVCERPSAMDELPDDIFTQEQRLQGAIVLHFVGAIYFFTLLAVVCNDYFLPSIEHFCEDLEISKDVAAATFMAIAGTTPELFTNTISIFIADSDMGLGTIIGSMLFNTLGVAAFASLAAKKPLNLSWFPISRDCVIYSINVSILVAIAWDGRVMWYETVVMFVLFILYFVLLFQNHRFEPVIRNIFEKRLRCCGTSSYDLEDNSTDKTPTEVNTNQKSVPTVTGGLDQPGNTPRANGNSINSKSENEGEQTEEKKKQRKSLWRIPRDSTLNTIWWFYTWPIKLLLTLTIPSPKTYRNLYPLTFILCIIYIGLNSFMVFWMVAIIGYTFYIPDAIMGFTFLAMGGCLPEAISSVILVRKGQGGVGVSHSLGSNSLAILMSLGVPWFIRTMVDGAGYTGAYVRIYSYGIEFTIISILLAVAALFTIIWAAKFRLKKSVGIMLLLVYLVLVTFGILIEMDILFPSGNYC